MDFHCKYDIVVAGAGIAGCSAALAAARRGCKTALIEKQTLIGGLATSGLIFVYLPLCDGYGHQVTFGLAEELLKRSLKYGPYGLPPQWGGTEGRVTARNNRYECFFTPSGFILSLDEALREAGVELWLETTICQVNSDKDGTVRSVEVENMSGHGIVEASCFIDSTGSAHLVRRSGGKVTEDENTLSVWFMQNSPEEENQGYNILDTLHIKTLHENSGWLERGGALNGKNTTEYTRKCWQKIRSYYNDCYEKDSSARFTHFPVHLPAMAEFRKLASATGTEALGDNDYACHRDSSIGMIGDWRQAGPIWETPFGALVPQDTGAVFTAGRCIGATGLAWELYRVIPACAMTGEAAGIAAALCVESHCDSRSLAASRVQDVLRAKKIPLHIEDVVKDGDCEKNDLPLGVEAGIIAEDSGY